jgi:hypothetical protein
MPGGVHQGIARTCMRAHAAARRWLGGWTGAFILNAIITLSMAVAGLGFGGYRWVTGADRCRIVFRPLMSGLGIRQRPSCEQGIQHV